MSDDGGVYSRLPDSDDGKREPPPAPRVGRTSREGHELEGAPSLVQRSFREELAEPRAERRSQGDEYKPVTPQPQPVVVAEDKPMRTRFPSLTQDGKLSKEYEQIHQRIVVLRVISLMLVLVCIFIIVVFFSNPPSYLMFIPLVVLALAAIGWLGTMRQTRLLINVFWMGLAVWVFCFAAAMLLNAMISQFKSTAQERCTDTNFAQSYYTKGCTPRLPQPCIDTCVREVSKHLTIEAVVLTLMVVSVMSIAVHIGRGVSLKLPPTVTFVVSDSDDEDDEKKIAEEAGMKLKES